MAAYSRWEISPALRPIDPQDLRMIVIDGTKQPSFGEWGKQPPADRGAMAGWTVQTRLSLALIGLTCVVVAALVAHLLANSA